jgi:aminopeptidase N
MRTDQPTPVRLADYQPFAFAIDSTALDFQLQPSATKVRAVLQVRRTGAAASPLRLDGVRLKLISVAIDGVVLKPEAYDLTDEALTLKDVPDHFALTTEVIIDPAANIALEGLYMSGGRFCSQCEAEGFRKITYFPDRPDVLSRYTVRMEADATAFPRLLSNGNLVEQGAGANGRHYAVWNDPFPKPCYLFALVAGELDELADHFVTISGRTVDLRIYVDPGQASRAIYAMDALKRSMAWDEQAFGREYDLDLFMIVAVRDFNFGAMENKGLNIFNSSLLLADEATATDFDYERIESVVAHEYFHNWTGNRITCRDWFQLCVKEGLTVYRDQTFSGDQRGAPVQRIKDVKALRARQFTEDAGPLAHPVRPDAYMKIDNFYTATIYEKGSELIRMLHTLLGQQTFRAGMDVYFERWDGEATTVEAFIECFADASNQDLSAFFQWYGQAGTPRLSVTTVYDPAAKTLSLTLSQQTSPTPGQPTKVALPVPVRIGLLDHEGRVQTFTAPLSDVATDQTVLVLSGSEQTFVLTDVACAPVLSALRGFSAPVHLQTDAPPQDRYVLLAADPDLFNRWEAGQGLASDLIRARTSGTPDLEGEKRFAAAMGRALNDQAAEPAFKALLLGLPTEQEMAMSMVPADPGAIHEARNALRSVLASDLHDLLTELHDGMTAQGPFSPDAVGAGRRALRNAALDLLAAQPSDGVSARAQAHYQAGSNMTDMMGGLSALLSIGGAALDTVLGDFFQRWSSEPLVIDKWFALQARNPALDALDRVIALTAHPAFEARNPNRLRALVQTFASANPARFHHQSGAGYRFLADQILALDSFNPMTAARLVEPLGGWKRYRPDLGALMKAELVRISNHPGLSKNVSELVSKALI